MADFSLPILTSTYVDMVDVLKARDVDAIKWLDGTTTTNIPVGAKRWNSTNNYFEKFDGTTWGALTSKYMINVDLLDGCTVNDNGNSITELWTSSKIINQLSTKLDASALTTINNNIALKADTSYVNTQLNLKTNKSDTDSVNLTRADKYLAAQNVVKMIYDANKKLVKVRYNNNTDVDYEVLSYTSGKLSNVAHYVGGVLKGNTTLIYSGGLLDSAPFVAV